MRVAHLDLELLHVFVRLHDALDSPELTAQMADPLGRGRLQLPAPQLPPNLYVAESPQQLRRWLSFSFFAA